MRHRETWYCGGLLLAVVLAVIGIVHFDAGAGVQDGPDPIPYPPDRVTDLYLDDPSDPGITLAGLDMCNGGVGKQTSCCKTCMNNPGAAGWLYSAECRTYIDPLDGKTKTEAFCTWIRGKRLLQYQ